MLFLISALCSINFGSAASVYSPSIIYHFKCEDNDSNSTVVDSGWWGNNGLAYTSADEAHLLTYAQHNTSTVTTGGHDGRGFCFDGTDFIKVNPHASHVSDREDDNLFTKDPRNPILTGMQFGSLWYDDPNYYFFASQDGNAVVYISTDQENWTGPTVILEHGAAGSYDGQIQVVNAFYDPSGPNDWSMLYRGYSGSAFKICLARSDSPTSGWAKYGSNPLDTSKNLDPTCMIKVDSTYYLYCNGNGGHGVTEVLTTTDANFTNWTRDSLLNPIFYGEQFCPTVFKYGSYYYMLLCIDYKKLGAGSDQKGDHAIQIWKSPDPSFTPQSRTYLGWAILNDQTYDDYYLDTPCLPYDNLDHDLSDRGSTLWCFYHGQSNGHTYNQCKATVTFSTLAAREAIAYESFRNNMPRSWFARVYVSSTGLDGHLHGLHSIGAGPGDSTPGFILSIKNNSGTLRLRWYNSGGWDDGVGAIGLNEWHHIGYTFDGANSWTFYIDGEVDATDTGTDHHGEGPEFIGTCCPYACPYGRLYGRMDDIICFDYCLTRAEGEAIISAYCSDYFVDPNGDDDNDGSIDAPFATIGRAEQEVQPGDTIFLRGGQHDYSATITISKSGQDGNMITLQAYQDEVVVLDFNDQPRISNYRGIVLTGDYWHFKGFTVRNSADNGIYTDSSYNIFEQLVTRSNGDSGIQLYASSSSSPAYNLVINCDSYLNYDPYKNGENADGFAAKGPSLPSSRDIGPGNVFRGCRAWSNSDDGWDFWYAGNPVTVENCWAFHNGENIWGDPCFAGDGNGFKLGQGTGAHLVTRCLAYSNAHRGFDRNGNTTGTTVNNCTGMQNGSPNFYFDLNSSAFVLRNDISYSGTVQIAADVDDTYNTWNSGFSVGAADFVSLDPNGLDGPREPDGSLPKLAYLRLSPDSSLVDAGTTQVNLPFEGYAPDLGAFEYIAGDCHCDGDVDMEDLECFVDNWLDTDCGQCNGADFDGNNDVDFYDFAMLANNWLK